MSLNSEYQKVIEMNGNTKNIQKLFFAMMLGVFILFSVNVSAQTQGNNVVGMQSEPYEVPKGPVTIYGHTLNPYFDFYESPEYELLTWDSVKFMVPEVLPDAKKTQLSKEKLCDMMVDLSLKYSTLTETAIGSLAYKAKDHFPDISAEPVLMDEVGLRLESKHPSKLNELIKMLPDNVNQIMAARDIAMKNRALVVLRDAALMNCPEHARASGYQMYIAPYMDEDKLPYTLD